MKVSRPYQITVRLWGLGPILAFFAQYHHIFIGGLGGTLIYLRNAILAVIFYQEDQFVKNFQF